MRRMMPMTASPIASRWPVGAGAPTGSPTFSPDGLVFFAGCSEEQAEMPFDYRVLLTPRSVLRQRLRTRTSNTFRTSR